VSDAVLAENPVDKKVEKPSLVARWNFFKSATTPSTAVNRPMTNINPQGNTKN
jgi:hypothetical protein